MKTRSNNQKTENSSAKRMLSRVAVVVFSLVIISLTSTSAQELWEQFFNEGNYGKMVELKMQEPAEFKEADAAVEAILTEADAKLNHSTESFAIETEPDNALIIEPWMTDQSTFASNSFTVTEDAEPELNVESWMINNSNFNNANATLATDAEPALAIEPWMTDESTFASNSFTVTEEADPEMNVESWMIDNTNFGNANATFATDAEPALEIEPWMMDSNNFKSGAERTDKDPMLNVESWMLDNPNFKNTGEKPLQLEAWMTNSNLWGF